MVACKGQKKKEGNLLMKGGLLLSLPEKIESKRAGKHVHKCPWRYEVTPEVTEAVDLSALQRSCMSDTYTQTAECSRTHTPFFDLDL